jgi:hypothetical protein
LPTQVQADQVRSRVRPSTLILVLVGVAAVGGGTAITLGLRARRRGRRKLSPPEGPPHPS